MESETTTTPSKKSPISTPAAIITAAVILGLALIISFGPKAQKDTTGNKNTAQAPAPVTSIPKDVATAKSTDRVRGDASTASVTLIEYADSDCYYCQQVHPTLKALMQEYAGKLAWVYRYFPINSLHPNAYTEALALECAGELGGNDAFWKYLDTIIDVTLAPNPTSNKSLTTFAINQKIDGKMFEQCMANAKTATPIDAGIKEAQTIGAQGTPFIVLVNKTGKQVVIPGAYPIEEFRKQIDSLLN